MARDDLLGDRPNPTGLDGLVRVATVGRREPPFADEGAWDEVGTGADRVRERRWRVERNRSPGRGIGHVPAVLVLVMGSGTTGDEHRSVDQRRSLSLVTDHGQPGLVTVEAERRHRTVEDQEIRRFHENNRCTNGASPWGVLACMVSKMTLGSSAVDVPTISPSYLPLKK